MPSDKSDLRPEIAHVLFMDVVGYSKLSINDQTDVVAKLNEVVRQTDEFRAAEAAGKLVRLPTGDGMALVFFNSPEAPVRCAVEISRALKNEPAISLRMGINSGPVNEVLDVNERSNVAGAGIDNARRVMECGDAGHILLSKRAADDLMPYQQWRPHLQELGETEIKHGDRISIFNFYTGEAGNPRIPAKLKQRSAPRSTNRTFIVAGAATALVVLIAIGALFVRQRSTSTLSAVEPVAVAAPEKSIAVLPFENLSKDEENAFFAAGVQDEILTNLSKIADLKVISRTSVMQYKNTAVRNLRAIAQELGVAHVLEGSVQRAANRVRVTAQLIDARTDAHIWAQTYDRDLADVFSIQTEIAKAIADQLQTKISPRERTAIAAPPTTDPLAHDLYLQAKATEQKLPEHESLLEAVRLLNEAVARDPQFVSAYCMLSRIHLILYFGGLDRTPARRELANVAIQNAIRLAPDSGEVHLALARYAYQGFRDLDRAGAELELARRTLPNDADVFFLSGIIDKRRGRLAEAIANLERAVELDPRNWDCIVVTGGIYQGLRRYRDSARLFERAVVVTPQNNIGRLLRAYQPFFERADITPLHNELASILKQDPAATDISDVLFHCAMVERDSAAANRALATMPAQGISPGGNLVYPREWFAGAAARAFQNPTTANSAFNVARAIIEKIVRDQPDYAQAWGLLGRIDAALGRKDDAIREGRRACELLPLAKDANFGAELITYLAVTYAWTGENDLALEQLALSAQIPFGVSYGELKLNPEWDSLRGDPRFEKIVAALKPQ